MRVAMWRRAVAEHAAGIPRREETEACVHRGTNTKTEPYDDANAPGAADDADALGAAMARVLRKTLETKHVIGESSVIHKSK